MSTVLNQKIVECLKKNNINFKLFQHDPVYTSSTASNVIGHKEEEGTKSLALKTEDSLVVVTVSGIERVDFKLLKKLLNVKEIQMCNVDVIQKNLGTEIGGLAPFGYNEKVIIIVSKILFQQKNVYFNAGQNDITICVSGTDFQSIIQFYGGIII